MLDLITPVVLTYNEAPNIERTLQALTWARRIVVMDSFSADATEAICTRFDNVEFVQRQFDQHANQWNAAITQNITSEWTLALDADHVLSDELIEELSGLQPAPEVQAFWAAFIYKIRGRQLRGSLYPPLLSLFRTGAGHYRQDGHTQRLAIDGRTQHLQHKIYHDDRKLWQRWLASQRHYANQEARKLASTHFIDMPLQDQVRYLGLAPLLVVPYTLIVKGTVLSGLPGLEYAWQRLVAEIYLQVARIKPLS